MVNLTLLLCESFKPSSPKNLYKFLVKTCSQLPPDAGKFYKTAVRTEYDQHREEDDPERIQQIMERAVRDAEWIIKKYKKQ